MNAAQAQRQISAVHEVGHLFVAQHLGYEAAMHLNAERGGHVIITGDDPTPEHDVLIALAGHAAEQIVFGFCYDAEEPVDAAEHVLACFTANPAEYICGDLPYNDAARAGDFEDWAAVLPEVEAILLPRLDEIIAKAREVVA